MFRLITSQLPVQIATALACALVSHAAAAATMDRLLEGHDLRLEYRDGSNVTVTFDSSGAYRTSAGSNGTWTLEGEALCTVRSSDSYASCGVLDSDKSPGEQWLSFDGEGKPVTAIVTPAQ